MINKWLQAFVFSAVSLVVNTEFRTIYHLLVNLSSSAVSTFRHLNVYPMLSFLAVGSSSDISVRVLRAQVASPARRFLGTIRVV
jgi:hypothetical protein